LVNDAEFFGEGAAAEKQKMQDIIMKQQVLLKNREMQIQQH